MLDISMISLTTRFKSWYKVVRNSLSGHTSLYYINKYAFIRLKIKDGYKSLKIGYKCKASLTYFFYLNIPQYAGPLFVKNSNKILK